MDIPPTKAVTIPVMVNNLVIDISPATLTPALELEPELVLVEEESEAELEPELLPDLVDEPDLLVPEPELTPEALHLEVSTASELIEALPPKSQASDLSFWSW